MKRFRKNKNMYYKVGIGVAVLIGILIGIVFYNSFAYFEETKTFNIIEGRVPTINRGDIKFAVVLDGEASSTFPKSGDGYVLEKSECTNNAEATWNSDNWTVNVANLENTNTYCKLFFRTGKLFKYTDGVQEFIVNKTGNYKIELWGAQGLSVNNRTNYSTGGYVSGEIYLEQSTTPLYVYVGEAGNNNRVVTFNGGGYGGTGNGRNGGSGGGATDIRLVNGDWDTFTSLKSRIMVAGAGGGAYGYTGGVGQSRAGGLTGYIGAYYTGHGDQSQYGMFGTQTAGGLGATTNLYGATGENYAGGFGFGGSSETTGSSGTGSSGGGSGYYGGGSGGGCGYGGSGEGGGGGSSFISGHNGCDAIKENSTENNIIHTGQSVHYSGLKFTNTKMIDGAGYSWTNVKGELEAMPKPEGGYYELGYGHVGNGYAKITYLGE